MIQKLRNKTKDQKGFTLIELLAVIVILGILAAIAVPSILGIIQNSKVSAVKAEAIQVYNSAKLYHTQYPTKATIAQADLSGYLENVSYLTSYSASYDSTNEKITVTCAGTAGKITVNIYGATLTDLNTDSKWDVTDGAITIGTAPK